MKFIIAIMLSVVISVFFLGALTVSGIVSIGKSENNTSLTITLPIPGRDSKVTDITDMNDINDKKFNVDTDHETKHEADHEVDHEADNIVTKTSTINTQALLFFENLKIKESQDIEELFARFLVQEYSADEKMVDLMIRKCLWKNFHTLQTPLDSFNSLKSFKTEYLMEKKLKTAGFNAMGLTLMEKELKKADSQFKLLQEKMSRDTKEKTLL